MTTNYSLGNKFEKQESGADLLNAGIHCRKKAGRTKLAFDFEHGGVSLVKCQSSGSLSVA